MKLLSKGLIAGAAGFALCYFILPWASKAWANYNKAKMEGQLAIVFGKLFDDIFFHRLIHPAEWAGSAIFVACVLLGGAKGIAHTDLDRRKEDRLARLAKMLARFLDWFGCLWELVDFTMPRILARDTSKRLASSLTETPAI